MTTPSFPIDDYTRRPRRYMNVDGVVELSWSTVLLGFAFIAWLQSVTPADSVWHGHWAQLLCLCAIALGVHFGGKAVKSRLTFRRTGYVQYRGSRTAPWVAAGTALVIAAVLTVLSGGHFRNPLTLLVAVVNILFYCVVTRVDRAWRWLALVLMFAGAAWMAASVPGRLALNFTALAFFGLVWLVSGTVTLWLYLRQPRTPEQGDR